VRRSNPRCGRRLLRSARNDDSDGTNTQEGDYLSARICENLRPIQLVGWRRSFAPPERLRLHKDCSTSRTTWRGAGTERSGCWRRLPDGDSTAAVWPQWPSGSSEEGKKKQDAKWRRKQGAKWRAKRTSEVPPPVHPAFDSQRGLWGLGRKQFQRRRMTFFGGPPSPFGSPLTARRQTWCVCGRACEKWRLSPSWLSCCVFRFPFFPLYSGRVDQPGGPVTGQLYGQNGLNGVKVGLRIGRDWG